jgi:hypothetical protein
MYEDDRPVAFHVDFNWDRIHSFASPGLFSHADARQHVEWYKRLGVNTIYAFCVSVNGYAWYQSKVAPVTPGLEREFSVELAELGKAQDWTVMGYFCIGGNGYWRHLHPGENHPVRDRWHIPLTRRYLDYLGASVRDALTRMPMDGFMIDWLWEVEPTTWLPCEREMYKELLGEPFPKAAVPAEVTVEFGRRAVDRAWRTIRDATGDVQPDAILFLSLSDADDPQIRDSSVLRDADWVVNEPPDVDALVRLREVCKPEAVVWQCVTGWAEVHPGREHDAAALVAALGGQDGSRIGLHGFARADEVTTLPPDDEGLNAKNIAALRRLRHGS